MTDHPIFHGTLKVVDAHLIDGKGRDVMTLAGGPQRLADCANALQDVWFPLAHVPAMDNRIERLEQLRKEAVSRIPEDVRYTDAPETADDTGQTGMVLGTGKERPLSIGLHTDGYPEARFETVSVHQEQAPAPALLRLEPAGEASASPWRFDMENAPRGSHTITTRQTKDGPREIKTPKREVIFVAGEDGHVTQSYWIPDAERWCMFTKDSPPIAWMAWPSHPGISIENAVAA